MGRVLLLAVLSALSPVIGQVPVTGAEEPAFHSDATLVLMPFRTSLRPDHALITPLKADDIEIREDGVPRTVALLESGARSQRNIPIDVILLFDCSRSMADAGLISPKVIKPNLLDELENVRLTIYGFSGLTVRLVKPTRDVDKIATALEMLRQIPSTGTPLYRALSETITDAVATSGPVIRKVVIFSDGEAGPARVPFFDKSVGLAVENGISIYPVALGSQQIRAAAGRTDSRGGGRGGGPSLSSDPSLAAYLSLAKLTGGRAFQRFVNSESALVHILKSVVADVETEYVTGFYPLANAHGAHHVKVTLRNGATKISWGGDRSINY